MEITDSLFLSLNFEGKALPKQIELIPPGVSVTGRDGRAWKNPSPARVAEASMKRLPALPIDANHAIDLAAPKGGESPAFGWMTNLRAEKDGSVWADVEWTERGREALLKKEYKYISPVLFSDAGGEINCILRAALTNSPNFALPALNAAEYGGARNNDNTEDFMKKELCAALGLPETASDTDALAAVNTLKAQANSDRGGGIDLQVFAPRADLNAAVDRAEKAEKQMAELNAARLKTDAESAVDAAVKAGKFPPASKGFYLDMCATQEGLDKFKACAENAPVVMSAETQVPAGSPLAGGTVALNAEDAAIAKAMGYTADEFAKVKEAGK